MVNKKKKGKNAIVLLSHNLLEHQIEELERKWNVGNIIYLPEELQKRWSNVDPELEFYNKDSLINDINKFIENNSYKEDIIIVQGEAGVTFSVVNLCFELGRKPIYATTKRVSQEVKVNGQVIIKRIFKHVRFREYLR